jgi:hypothetical protein
MTATRSPGRPPARAKAKRHSSRQRKLACNSCGFICYASAGAVIACGLPVCACGQPLSVALPRDLAVIDPDGFEQLAGRLSKAAHNRLMRACGFDAMILRDKGHDPIVARMRAARQKRCAADGCGRFAANGSPTCAQHGAQAMPF